MKWSIALGEICQMTGLSFLGMLVSQGLIVQHLFVLAL